ncbi:MAG: DUF4391 domain-containing protein [Eubacterium sp.]|nr:DUF4391 domain-containing protein [Eubacterium sp.]
MIGLPKSTEFNKRIPKQSFYENLDVSPTMKKFFIDQIKVVYWRNKIAPTTINLAAGNNVTELQVFEIRLNGNEVDESVLTLIDKNIPYHILFVLSYNGKYKAVIGYKEAARSGSTAFKVNRYYYTEWMAEHDLPLHLEGLDIDSVYENYVRQIAGDTLQDSQSGESLKETVERDNRIRDLKKQITALQAKIRKEKQLNVQMQMNSQLKKLKKELKIKSMNTETENKHG